MSEKAPQAQPAAQPAQVNNEEGRAFAGAPSPAEKDPGSARPLPRRRRTAYAQPAKTTLFCRRATKPGSARTFSR